MSSGARNAAAATERAFKQFQDQLRSLEKELDISSKRIVGKMAAIGLRETVRNTPVGEYKTSGTKRRLKKPGKSSYTQIGGTLRRGWKLDGTKRVAGGWRSGYSNSVEYAPYVNDGHRIVRDGKTVGWVPGRHMLEIGTRAAERALPSLFNAEIARIKGKTGF